jgi:hypothetical protein
MTAKLQVVISVMDELYPSLDEIYPSKDPNEI